MSAVSDILFVVSVFREFGVPVTFEPGWETRGNGQQTSGYQGSVIHHTAVRASYANPGPTRIVLRDGRPDLDGPLCNGQVRFDGGVHIIAAQPANHAGASGGYGTAPLPNTRLFNPVVMGWEIDYAGDSPMSAEQDRTAKVISIATKRLRDRPSHDWTKAHAETSIEGKWDPGDGPGHTIDMARFRRDAAALTGDDIVTPQEMEAVADLTVEKLKTALVYFSWRDPNDPAGRIDDSVPFWAMWAQLYPTMFHGGGFNTAWGPGVLPRLMAIEEAVAKVAEANGLNREQFLADIREAAKQGAAEGESVDNAEEAAAVVRELATRLAIDPITGKQNGAA